MPLLLTEHMQVSLKLELELKLELRLKLKLKLKLHKLPLKSTWVADVAAETHIAEAHVARVASANAAPSSPLL